jgi:hypothetical protein
MQASAARALSARTSHVRSREFACCAIESPESTFATVRHRTIRSKGCLSNKTALAMVYKLTDAAQKSWRRLDGPNQLPKLSPTGVEVISPQTQAAA